MSEEIITKRLHISGLTPAITTADLSQKLGSFGTIKALDGFGKLDGLGQPRKYGYVTIQTTKAKLARCMNILSGATWKGAKLRIGEAKPDFRERIAQENGSLKRPSSAEDDQKPGKKRRLPRGVQGVHADDMSLVTPENVEDRSGWKVTPLGRLIRPIRMRPAHPLPDPLVTNDKVRTKQKKGPKAEKRKRVKEPPTRARRRTIDPTKWGSQHLKGSFLEASGTVDLGNVSDLRRKEQTSGEENSNDESEEESETPTATTKNIEQGVPPVQASKPVSELILRVPSTSPIQATPTIQQKPSMSVDPLDSELQDEKKASLGLLASMFGDKDDDEWGGKESVDSDMDVEDISPQKVAEHADGEASGSLAEEEEEEQPMKEAPSPAVRYTQDAQIAEQSATKVQEETPVEAQQGAVPPPSQPVKLKDLFAVREEREQDAGFSLLGHLDLDEDLDDDILELGTAQEHPAVFAEAEEELALRKQEAAVPITNKPLTSADRIRYLMSNNDTLFFPQPRDANGRHKWSGKKKDPLDVSHEMGWDFEHVDRSLTSEEMRRRWEENKVEWTRDYKKRHREAVKSRRRRGGPSGDLM